MFSHQPVGNNLSNAAGRRCIQFMLFAVFTLYNSEDTIFGDKAVCHCAFGYSEAAFKLQAIIDGVQSAEYILLPDNIAIFTVLQGDSCQHGNKSQAE